MIKKIAISLLAFLIVFTGLFMDPLSAQAEPLGYNECAPAVLLLRGSGEENIGNSVYRPEGTTTDFIKTNGGEGSKLSQLLQEFANETNPAETVSKVRFVGIDYPSAPVFPELPSSLDSPENYALAAAIVIRHVIDYNDSYRAGAVNTVNFIKQDEQRGCDTQYMIVSYSQGVIASRLAMNLLNHETNKVISSYAIGDPFQKMNGASSSLQKTAANTSPGTMGTGLLAAKIIRDGAISSGAFGWTPLEAILTPLAIAGIKTYTDEVTAADHFIYRNEIPTVLPWEEPAERIVSRSLCHANDMVCGIINPRNHSEEQHTNYFDGSTSPGSLDIALDVPEFDKQVQRLANTASQPPRPGRVLTKTPSVEGQATTYNVANARADDMCHWDEGADGSFEVVTLCNTHSVIHAGQPKMRVKVVDSFGMNHVYNSKSDVIAAEAVDSVLSLDSNTWYQFQPYQEPDGWREMHPYDDRMPCLNYWQSYASLVNDDSYFDYSSCTNEYNEPSSYGASQVFRQSGEKLLWGYDDNYALANGSYEATIHSASNSSTQGIKAKLTTYIDNIGYHVIQQGDQCLSMAYEYGSVSFITCDSNDLSQLFRASVVPGSFGAFSIERDVTPPTPVTGLRVEMTTGSAQLKWEHSTDGRATYTDYRIYRGNTLVKTQGWNEYTLPNKSGATYTVVAVDFAGHVSVADTITFGTLPTLVSGPPPVPTLVGMDYDAGTITIQFHNYGNNNARVRLWERNSFHSVQPSGAVYVDTETPRGQVSMFNYQLEVAPNVYTPRSEMLSVRLEP